MMRTPADLCEALGIAFSDEQLAAITAPLSPAVIIAGAGSGKTTVMAARVVWLVGTGAVRPGQVLGLTFTRKAAAELSQRVRSALERAGVVAGTGVDDAGEEVVLTYDAFAGRVVDEYGLRMGIEGASQMLTGAARFQLAARVVARAAGPFEFLSRLRPASVVERVLALDSDLQAHLADAAALDLHARRYLKQLEAAPTKRGGQPYVSVKAAAVAAQERLELASLVADYRRLKSSLGLVEFADQMALAARLVKSVDSVATDVRSQFAVVLLDEYQDTSSAQAELLHGLFSAGEGQGHAVTAVGDPYQAIYGWRGAAASNILTFSQQFRTADGGCAASYSLTVNRRSAPEILTGANAVAAPLALDPALGGAQRELVAPPGSSSGTIEVARFEGWPDEARWLADDLLASQHGGIEWRDHAVLCRRNADVAALYGAFTSHDIPCEIVGLGGLLHLPEVADVVATLRVVDDVAANPDVVRLLTGTRWAIGRGDLALLGARAAEIASTRENLPDYDDSLMGALEQAVADVDPTDIVCLLDAIEDPGDAPYGDGVLERLSQFAAELRYFRAHADEPVTDLMRRIVVTIGLDVELMSTPERVARGGNNQLASFADAVAGYVEVEGDASLAGVLAYLEAEENFGAGLEQATPSAADSVKLLTIHKAKGLEWHTVYIPALVDGTFPNDRVSDNWVKRPSAIPGPLRGDADSVPQLGEPSQQAFVAFEDALKGEARRAEDRLAYVAVTRAKRRLVASGHWWRAETQGVKRRSDYLETLWGLASVVHADAPEPAPKAENPFLVEAEGRSWPARPDPEARSGLLAAAALVERPTLDDTTLNADDASTVARWDANVEFLISEATGGSHRTRYVELPASLTASQVLAAHRDPQRFAESLLRPMPRPPSPAASLGTAFHAWVEARFSQDVLPGVDDALDTLAVEDPGDLHELCEAFSRGQFADTAPAFLEYPFTMVLGKGEAQRHVRGRIDAVYAGVRGFSWLLVDWKSSRQERADPLQLAVYRQAWAEIRGVPPSEVGAAFYYVRTDHLQVCANLPDGPALAKLVRGLTSADG